MGYGLSDEDKRQIRANARRRGGGRSSRGSDRTTVPVSISGVDKFEGKVIKVVFGATGRRERFEFYYGGAMHPDGPGHGHVVCNDGETINYWRKPGHEGGQVVIDDGLSSEKLADHMF
jgi:hypothetical protein